MTSLVDTEEDGAPAGGRAGRALAWSIANTVVGRAGTLAIGIALARLLGPAEFGTYAVAFVALVAILSFNELGVSLAIVRWRDDPAAIAPTVNTISLLMSAALTLVAVLGAASFAEAMGDPQAAPLVRLLSLCVLVNGAVATPAALLQRTFRQDQRMLADQVNTWIGALVSIALAVAGAGAASLAVGRLAGSLLAAGVLLRCSPLPYRVGLDRRHVRALLAFGVPLAGSSVVVFLVGFLDQLVVGHLLGPVLLGSYVLATNLAGWPVSIFSQPLRSVAPAMFARLQHDPRRMRDDLHRVLRPLAAVALPVCGAIAVVAPDLVQLVYGDDWAAAGPVLRWLAVLAAYRILAELTYDYLVVRGRSTSILLVQLAGITALAPALWVGVRSGGVEGAAVAVVAVSMLVSGPLYLADLRRTGVSVRHLLIDLSRPVVTTALLAAAVALVLQVAPGLLLGLVLAGLLTTATSACLLHLVRRDLEVLRAPAPISEPATAVAA